MAKASKVFFQLLIMMFLTQVVQAQSKIEDARLALVFEELPNGWTAKIKKDTLILERTDSIWVMHGNWHNAHFSTWELKDDSAWIMGNGERTTAHISFQLVKKMEKKAMTKFIKKNKWTYGGLSRWNKAIFNSENYTLLEIEEVGKSDFDFAVWPKVAGDEISKVYGIVMKNIHAMN